MPLSQIFIKETKSVSIKKIKTGNKIFEIRADLFLNGSLEHTIQC